MRAFLGISIPKELSKKLVILQKQFSTFDIKFVEEENVHFNLKFFGEIDEKQIEGLRKSLTETLENYGKFDICLNGVGSFPSKTYIRVLWVGVKEGKPEMIGLVKTVDSVATKFGFEGEKDFVPHLTLGRVRSGKNKEMLVEKTQTLENIVVGSMTVGNIVLFESELGTKGPVYKKIFSINL